MRYRGGGSGSAPSPVCVEDEWRRAHTEKGETTYTHIHTHNHDTPHPQQSDRPSGIVHDNTGWHGTWGAGCPQCDSTQGQDASTGFFRCASQSKEQPDGDICQVSVRRFTDWCPTFFFYGRISDKLTPPVRGMAPEKTVVNSCCFQVSGGVSHLLVNSRLRELFPESTEAKSPLLWLSVNI